MIRGPDPGKWMKPLKKYTPTFSLPLFEWQWLHSVARLIRETHSYKAFKTGNRYAHCFEGTEKVKDQTFSVPSEIISRGLSLVSYSRISHVVRVRVIESPCGRDVLISCMIVSIFSSVSSDAEVFKSAS